MRSKLRATLQYVRDGGADWKENCDGPRLDNPPIRAVIAEKLLSIIGADVRDINRKNKPYWSGIILRLRMTIVSNELPDFK